MGCRQGFLVITWLCSLTHVGSRHLMVFHQVEGGTPDPGAVLRPPRRHVTPREQPHRRYAGIVALFPLLVLLLRGGQAIVGVAHGLRAVAVLDAELQPVLEVHAPSLIGPDPPRRRPG